MFTQEHPRTRQTAPKTGAVVYRFPAPRTQSNQQLGRDGAVYWSAIATVEPYQFDEEYLSRLRDRDAATEAHFVSYFNALLKAKLRSDRYADSALNDIRQETLYRVLKKIYENKIDNPASLRSFVYGVCERVKWEYARGEWRLAQDEGDEFPEVSDERTPADGPARQAEMRDIVRQVLGKLPEKDRKILVALFLDDKDRDEICRELDITRDNFRVVLHRALASARKSFGHGAHY